MSKYNKNPARPASGDDKPRYIKVDEMRPANDESTCLRPLGLYDLGGGCDSCWYSPDNPRIKKGNSKPKS